MTLEKDDKAWTYADGFQRWERVTVQKNSEKLRGAWVIFENDKNPMQYFIGWSQLLTEADYALKCLST